MALSFACKQLDIREVVRCGLQLSKGEMRVFEASVSKSELSAGQLAATLKIDRTTAQKALGKLLARGLVLRKQRNRSAGGYQYYYQPLSREEIRRRVAEIANTWFAQVKAGLKGWP